MRFSVFIMLSFFVLSLPIYGSAFERIDGVYKDDYIELGVYSGTASWLNEKGGGVSYSGKFILSEKKSDINFISIKLNGKEENLIKGKLVNIKPDKTEFTFELNYETGKIIVYKKIQLLRGKLISGGGSHPYLRAEFKVIESKIDKKNVKKIDIKKSLLTSGAIVLIGVVFLIIYIKRKKGKNKQ